MSNNPPGYRGRFAPSPTGPLHKGSLVAAIASYLEALKHQGEWLVRMEDVDELRNIQGAADSILRSLEAYGFEWQGEVIYQTNRHQAYQQALDHLSQQQLTYPCTCSRKQLRAMNDRGEIRNSQFAAIYPGSCRNNTFQQFPHNDYSIRILAADQNIQFNDAIYGQYQQNLQQDIGDFIIRRRDGLFAYQLAVVVDDETQNITHIVRGADLLDSSPRQIYLQQCLGYQNIHYTHIPLITHSNGDKLSKQTGAEGIGHKANLQLMVDCLEFLGLKPPQALAKSSLNNIWQWAQANWQLPKPPKI